MGRIKEKAKSKKMKTLIKMFFLSMISLASCSSDSDKHKNIIEIDKTLSVWVMYQYKSCSALEGVVGNNVKGYVTDGGSHLNILRNQKIKILPKILELNNSAAEEKVSFWVKSQQNALDELLTQSISKDKLEYSENPKRLLEIQEDLLNQILTRRLALEKQLK